MKELSELSSLIKEEMKNQHFDTISVGVVDFSSLKYKTVEYSRKKGAIEVKIDTPFYFFDLASLTKPLTSGVIFLQKPEVFKNNLKLKSLLNHHGGLPSGGFLDRKKWKEELLKFPIDPKSQTLYSDYSHLRLLLELENEIKLPFIDYCQSTSLIQTTIDELTTLQNIQNSPKLFYWRALFNFCKKNRLLHLFPQTGVRNSSPICGEVHDHNAYNIPAFCSHAGLFAKIDALCEVILELETRYSLLKRLKSEYQTLPTTQRFVGGWDQVQDIDLTLAGKGAALTQGETFGHLGFTGTSIWFSTRLRLGHIILSNATQNYFYSRTGLNQIRRKIGEWVWKNGKNLFS